MKAKRKTVVRCHCTAPLLPDGTCRFPYCSPATKKPHLKLRTEHHRSIKSVPSAKINLSVSQARDGMNKALGIGSEVAEARRVAWGNLDWSQRNRARRG